MLCEDAEGRYCEKMLEGSCREKTEALPHRDSPDSSLDKVHIELPLQRQRQPDGRLRVPEPAGVDPLLQEDTAQAERDEENKN